MVFVGAVCLVRCVSVVVIYSSLSFVLFFPVDFSCFVNYIYSYIHTFIDFTYRLFCSFDVEGVFGLNRSIIYSYYP